MKSNQIILAKNIEVGMKVKSMHFELWQVVEEVRIWGGAGRNTIVTILGREGKFMYYASSAVEISSRRYYAKV